jgi:hypothetical protein
MLLLLGGPLLSTVTRTTLHRIALSECVDGIAGLVFDSVNEIRVASLHDLEDSGAYEDADSYSSDDFPHVVFLSM